MNQQTLEDRLPATIDALARAFVDTRERERAALGVIEYLLRCHQTMDGLSARITAEQYVDVWVARERNRKQRENTDD